MLMAGKKIKTWAELMVKSNVFLDRRVCSWSSDHNTANWINKSRATERERERDNC